MFKIITVAVITIVCSSTALADYDDWDDDDDDYVPGYYQVQPRPYGYYREEIVYVPERIVEYVPAPQRYYAPPQPQYYYNRPSPQGMLGAVAGGAIGYSAGYGNPIAAGIGAATGAWMGNGW